MLDSTLLILLPAGFVLGLLINYLADVLPRERRLSAPVCVYCGQKIPCGVYLRPRPCPACGKARLARTWIVPLAGGLALAWLWYLPPRYLTFWEAAAVLAFFTLVTIMDIEHRIIMHKVNLAGVVIALAVGVSHRGWLETLLGGAAGFCAMLVFYYVGIWYARAMRRRNGLAVEDDEALGFGDVTLSGVIGLMLGWPAITAGLFVGILAAGLIGVGIVGISLLSKKYNALASIPYGPFLVLGAVVILYLPW